MRKRFTDGDPRWKVRVGGVYVQHPIEADEERGELVCYGTSTLLRDEDGTAPVCRDLTGRALPIVVHGPVEIVFVHPTPREVQ